MNQPTIIKTLPIAFFSALVATRLVHGRAGDESFVCDGTACELGSGTSWLFTGVALLGPFIALGGFFWARYLHQTERLGPFNHRAIPDGEEIVEVLWVLGAALVSYWLILNGPSIEPVRVGGVNEWAARLREFRLADEATRDQVANAMRVPSRFSWFLVGVVLGSPFMFSLGSMLGREWYGSRRLRAEQAEAATDIDLTAENGYESEEF